MARIPFNAIVGAPASDGVTVVVVALDNGAMTWELAGQSGTVTLTKWADDRSPAIPSGPRAGQTWAGYTGSFTVSGLTLQSLSQLTGTITQAGVTLTVAFRAIPVKGDKFRIINSTCYDPQTDGGFYGYMAADMFSTDTVSIPIACAVHNDDIGYVDTQLVDDLTGTGHQSTGDPATTNLLYDFAVAWMLRLGLIGDGITAYEARYFSELNHLMVPGSHERTDLSSGGATWNTLFTHCHGTAFSAPLVSLPYVWQKALGDYKFVVVDGEGLVANTDTVLDTLNNLNTSEGIKFVLRTRPIPWRAMSAVGVLRWSEGDTRLLYASGQTPKSISDNPLLNGVKGVCVVINGDRHNASFTTYAEPAGAGTVAEKFALWMCGGTTSGGHLGADGAVKEAPDYIRVDNYPEGTVTSNATIVYKVNIDPNTGLGPLYYDPRGPQQSWTRITCYGDEYPARVMMEFRRANLSGVVYSAFTRHFTAQGLTDNYGSATPVRNEQVSVSSGDE